MRQAPAFLILGDGRVARHISHYLTLLNINHLRWCRADGIERLTPLVKDATHILIALSDGAVELFINEHLLNSPAYKIHFSGALSTPLAFGTHPLMTFGTTLYTLEKYQSIPFVLDNDAPDFNILFPHFKNPHERISKDKKALYHAWCVMSGNFTCLLWQGFFTALENDLSLPSSIAHEYLKQQMENLLTDPQNALTGPLVRGDTATLEKNLLALGQSPYAQIYQSFVSCYKETKK